MISTCIQRIWPIEDFLHLRGRYVNTLLFWFLLAPLAWIHELSVNELVDPASRVEVSIDRLSLVLLVLGCLR